MMPQSPTGPVVAVVVPLAPPPEVFGPPTVGPPPVTVVLLPGPLVLVLVLLLLFVTAAGPFVVFAAAAVVPLVVVVPLLVFGAVVDWDPESEDFAGSLEQAIIVPPATIVAAHAIGPRPRSLKKARIPSTATVVLLRSMAET
ncbi:MAG TPA: hypothetical protein VI197_01245 [Polyangiaceae bacterium]